MLGCTLILRAFIGDVPNPALRMFLSVPFYGHVLVLGVIIVAAVMLLLLVIPEFDWLDGGR